MMTTYTEDSETRVRLNQELSSAEDFTSCPECGKRMHRDSKPYTVVYKGLSEVVDMAGWYCDDDCGEAIFEGLDLEVSSLALRRLKARSSSVLLPDQVKAIRKKLELSQEKAGEIIGGGENAFYKYESGEVVLSKAVSNLLRVLEADPAGLKVLMPEKLAVTIG